MNIEKIRNPEQLLDSNGNFELNTRAIAQLMYACGLETLYSRKDLRELLFRAELLFPNSMAKGNKGMKFNLSYTFLGKEYKICTKDLIRHLGIDLSLHKCGIETAMWLDRMAETFEKSRIFALHYKCPLGNCFADNNLKEMMPSAKSLTEKAYRPNHKKYSLARIKCHQLSYKLPGKIFESYNEHLHRFHELEKERLKKSNFNVRFDYKIIPEYLIKTIIRLILLHFEDNSPEFNLELYTERFANLVWVEANGFLELDECGFPVISKESDEGLTEWLEDLFVDGTFHEYYFRMGLYELEEAFIGLF